MNYTTIIPPGKSTLILPTELYLAESNKAHLSAILDRSNIKAMALVLGKQAEAVKVGYVFYNLHRLGCSASAGSAYTSEPMLLKQDNTAPTPDGITRRFWLTVRPPENTPPGRYRAVVTVGAEHGGAHRLPLSVRVRRGRLLPADIPVGPFGHAIETPWDRNDPVAAQWNASMRHKILRLLREYGFTSISGLPTIGNRGFRQGAFDLDFSRADAEMAAARKAGFAMSVWSYGAGVLRELRHAALLK